MCVYLFAPSRGQPLCFSLWINNSATLGKIKTLKSNPICYVRAGVSDKESAIITSAVRKDRGMVESDEKRFLAHGSKISCEKVKQRCHRWMRWVSLEPLGVYFGRRRDKNISLEKKQKRKIEMV